MAALSEIALKMLLAFLLLVDQARQSFVEQIVDITVNTQCLKTTPKVAFNIASEASCIHILSGRTLILNAKNLISATFENLKFVKECYQIGHFK